VLTPPAAAMRDAEPRIASRGLEAALLLAPLAAAMSHAVLRIASSGLEAALLLAAFAASMCATVRRTAALNSLGAALFLTPPAPAMCPTVRSTAGDSSLGAAFLLAPFAPAMCATVRRAAWLNPLGAALQLTLPLAHGPPPSSLHVLPLKPNSLQRAIHSRHPPPLSPQHSASAHRTSNPRRWQCESRSNVGMQANVSSKVVKGAWAGDVRWVCSRAGWSGTPPHPPPPGSQAACPSCRSALDGHSPPLHGVHSTTEGHLGV
jgi:hypothetical protein